MLGPLQQPVEWLDTPSLKESPHMHAPIQHDALTYAMYPAAAPQPVAIATQLDNHHLATLNPRSPLRRRRALVSAFITLHGTKS